MAGEALVSNAAVEVRMGHRFITGRHVPQVGSCVVGDGRLKEPLAELDQVAGGMAAGSDAVG